MGKTWKLFWVIPVWVIESLQGLHVHQTRFTYRWLSKTDFEKSKCHGTITYCSEKPEFGTFLSITHKHIWFWKVFFYPQFQGIFSECYQLKFCIFLVEKTTCNRRVTSRYWERSKQCGERHSTWEGTGCTTGSFL